MTNPTIMAAAIVPPPPRWAVLCAWLLPIGILCQFLLAGLSLFQGSDLWEVHCFVGFFLGFPMLALIVGGMLRPPVRKPAQIAFVMLLDLAVQILLVVWTKANGWMLPQALHPFNAGLLLVLSVLLVASVGRTQAAR